MKRLTKKDYDGMLFWYRNKGGWRMEEIDKLGRYEDVDPRPNYLRKMKKEYLKYKEIEDKFGCDFIFLDNVCSNGVYCYEQSIKDCDSSPKGNIVYIPSEDIHVNFFGVCKEQRMGVVVMGCLGYVYHSLHIKDYGKTWALTREELE